LNIRHPNPEVRNVTSPLVAIVDDEPDILALVSLHLKKARFRVREFSTGEGFYHSLTQEKPDLVILDIMLPDMDGVEICKYMRGSPGLAAIPVIMLTARTEETDRVLGLEMGADDYVTKPFSPRELVARVKAVLRRSESVAPQDGTVRIGKTLTLDLNKYEAFVDDRKIVLTITEFRILQLLSSKIGWVFSREQILDYLWGDDKTVVDRTVDVHVRHLREKLGRAALLIKNVRGVGYKVEP
jgi:DNA-binding response OmpR family regulator